MKSYWILPILLSSFLLASCQNQQSPTVHQTSVFSLERKWFLNTTDDRYYCEFKSNGELVYTYYQYVTSTPSNLNAFVSKTGTWRYLNSEHTQFCVAWNDSIDCYYFLTTETNESISISKDSSGPNGLGLSSINTLYKSSNKIVNYIPDEILGLIGTWYYSNNLYGKYFEIKNDGNCIYHYYQDYGASSNLTGWVNIKGTWTYNNVTKELTITMIGEISYTYTIELLNINELKLSGNTSSMIKNSEKYYR